VKLPALALFERSLRLETRSALMCWSRTGLLGLTLLMLFPIQSMARVGYYGAPGLHFLQEMVWVNFLFITMAGLSYFASAITEEKEEMMLGLLRMTDLNPVAILLGKSTSRLVGALLLLLVQVPFILLAVTLGGVGLLQIMASYGTLLAYLFLVCNLALLFSVVFRNTTTAAAFTLGVLLLFLLGHYWAAIIVHDIASPGQINSQWGVWPTLTTMIDLWRQTTPSDRLSAIFRTGFAGPAVGFQVSSNLALGFLFFLLAWMVFDRCTREEKEAAPFRRWLLRPANRRRRIPPRLVGTPVISWRDFTFISGGTFGLLLKFGVVAIVVALFNLIALETGTGTNITREFEGGVFIWVSLIMTAVFLALEAGRVFREEIRWKTLSSLVTLPVSIPELAYRKVAGALVGTVPLLAGSVIGVMLCPDDVGKFVNDLVSEPITFGVFTVMILQYILFLHLTAFLSLIIKRGALPLAIAIQYLGGSFFITLLGIIFSTGGGSGPGTICFISGAICVATTIILHRAIGLRLARAAAEE
jgi:ABC-type transport system involved in multi-copper enzyme maturation permease subunit